MPHNKLNKLFIKSQFTIKRAMEVISKASKQGLPVGISLVVNENKQLIGTVTDGDIRKALLQGKTINDQVKTIMAKDPITVLENLGADEMIKAMQKKIDASDRFQDKKVDNLIIIDEENKVVDIIEYHELMFRRQTKQKTICIVGTGQVGLTLSVVLADFGFKVRGYDVNVEKIANLKKNKLDFYEKGVKPLLEFHLNNGNLDFVSSIENDDSDIYFICVGTPVDKKDNQPIIDQIKESACSVGNSLKKNNLVILRSTVTLGITRNTVLPILEKQSGLTAGRDFYLAFSPERVVEGNALEEIKTIPQIIGGIDNRSLQEAMRIFQKLGPPIVTLSSLEAAEMVKLVNNTFRDYCFGFSNNLVLLCEKLNLNTIEIISSATKGYPRNQIPMPSPGVGGYCLTKDPYLLADVAANNGLSTDVFTVGRSANEKMPHFISNKLLDFININHNAAKKIKIYVMGIAFKGYPETSDMRGSPAIDLINILKKKATKNLIISGFDNIVTKSEIEKLNIEFESYDDGFSGAHCVLIMNNHPNFSKINIFSLLDKMQKPGFFFDGWNFFSKEEIQMVNGLHYFNLGG